jgi:putrescine---pyruvate transaminase
MTTQANETRLWHPFADMSAVRGRELVISKGEGSWVTDVDGNRYLDASAALWYCNIGHGRAELAAAAAEQMQRLASYQIFDQLANPPALELAEQVSELAPTGDDSWVFLCSGGSDAIDSAAKIARRYWIAKGEPERTLIVSREGGYHGTHAFGTSLSGIPANGNHWGPLVEAVKTVPRHDADAVDELLASHEGQVAAFIGEPVQGASGVHPPVPGYWDAVQAACRRHDVLLIVDEVVCGFGRLGRWFGSERFGLRPDLVTVAKGLSSGYLPIGAVITSSSVAEPVFADGAFRHGYTYSGHPTASAVALANLGIIRDEGIVGRVGDLQEQFAETFGPLESHAAVAEVRTAGFLAGVEFSAEKLEERPDLAVSVIDRMRRKGVLARALLGHTIQISPPLIIEVDEMALIAEAVSEALADLT